MTTSAVLPPQCFGSWEKLPAATEPAISLPILAENQAMLNVVRDARLATRTSL
jgi:hypothetical protein